ncbi:hypothetical protein GQ457_17G003560 [Hibiscus cannabinus]
MFAASFDSKMGCLYSVFDAKKQGKPAWVVRTRNWKLRGGENRLSGLLEGVSIASVGKARRQGGSNITFVQKFLSNHVGNLRAFFSGPVKGVSTYFAELTAVITALEVFAETDWGKEVVLLVDSDSKVVLFWVENHFSSW